MFEAIRQSIYNIVQRMGFGHCVQSQCYPVAMNISGYLSLYEDTSATDFGPDRSIRLQADL